MFKDKKEFYMNVVFVALIAFVLVRSIIDFEYIKGFAGNFLRILGPFFWGFSIAYLLNPLMKVCEHKFKIKRIYTILLIYSIAIGIIVLSITIVSPRIAKSVGQILDDMPMYIEETQNWIYSIVGNYEMLEKYGMKSYLDKNLAGMIESLSTFLDFALNNLLTGIITFTSTFLNVILGIIISVYLLKDKEEFQIRTKRLIKAVFSERISKVLIRLTNEIDVIFSKFIIGKIIDSAIIGLICFTGLLFLKVKYNMLIAIIVGITNMIPYFGPFIGAVPAVIITLFYSPVKALWVLAFIVALQQFDGLILGPKILGDQVGLSPFWIILAIIIGGGLFGVIGMFLAVPICAMLKILIERHVDNVLSQRGE